MTAAQAFQPMLRGRIFSARMRSTRERTVCVRAIARLIETRPVVPPKSTRISA